LNKTLPLESITPEHTFGRIDVGRNIWDEGEEDEEEGNDHGKTSNAMFYRSRPLLSDQST
jgi:hypothetical protein